MGPRGGSPSCAPRTLKSAAPRATQARLQASHSAPAFALLGRCRVGPFRWPSSPPQQTRAEVPRAPRWCGPGTSPGSAPLTTPPRLRIRPTILTTTTSPYSPGTRVVDRSATAMPPLPCARNLGQPNHLAGVCSALTLRTPASYVTRPTPLPLSSFAPPTPSSESLARGGKNRSAVGAVCRGRRPSFG